MGQKKKKSNSGMHASKSDLRKKANKDERREVKHYLSSGKFEGLANVKKFTDAQIPWND